MNSNKVGLVLSGGGAKGAYQVGVLKALNQLGISVDAISGASIGALNGAILASAPSLKEGIVRLETIWHELAMTSPLEFKSSPHLMLLGAVSARLGGYGALIALTQLAQAASNITLPPWLKEHFSFIDGLQEGVLSDTPLQKKIDRYLNATALQNGLPLYVSIYKSQGVALDLLRCIIAEMGAVDTVPSEFRHIQALNDTEKQKETIMASAAIPILFGAKEVGQHHFVDGGMGGWQKMQGNTPITPLIQAGYKTIIVTHLSDGSLWDRHDYPDTTILEIRPQSAIARKGYQPDLLSFNAINIPSWIEQGYDDTMKCIGNVMQVTQARNRLKAAENMLQESTSDRENLDTDLEIAMNRILK